MDARTIELLAATFARVAARRDDAATIFCTRLFTTAPALRPSSFKHDFESQKAKLMSTLAQVVEYYRIGVDPESYLARLGESQDGYGAQRVQFEALGDALIFTLAQVLGDDFTPEVRAAWVAAYGEVAAAMMRAGDVASRSLYPGSAAARP
jgi:hemoglobin-like flavoprotein